MVAEADVKFAREELGDRRFLVRDLAAFLHGDDAVADERFDLGFDGAVGEFDADCRGCGYRAATGLRIAREFGQVLHDELVGDAGGDAAALEIERGGGEVPAAVLFAEELGGRDAHVFEVDLVEFVAVEHVDQRAGR